LFHFFHILFSYFIFQLFMMNMIISRP